MGERMGGSESRISRILRGPRPQHEWTDSNSDGDEEEDNVQAMLRYLLRYRGQARQVVPQDDNEDTQPLHQGLDSHCDLYKQIQLNNKQRSLSSPVAIDNVTQLLQQRQYGWCRPCSREAESVPYSSVSLPHYCHHVRHYSSRLFCGQYSRDGSLYACASQDQRINLFDTSRTCYRPYRSLAAPYVGWSILDLCFSVDQCYLAYCTWSTDVLVCNLHNDKAREGDFKPLDLRPDSDGNFGVFSVKFSGDGRTLLASANDGYLYLYNRERDSVAHRVNAHEDDINSTCYSNDDSRLIYSAGDDGLCKVWDTRIISSCNDTPVGVFAGHRDGISHVESKRDDRYLITNSKDQTIKLWDLRVFSSPNGVQCTRTSITHQYWDYRWQAAPKKFKRTNGLPGDVSVMTYRGHRVLQTAIRCRFSPMETTGNQYIVTGSASGSVMVYDILTGKVVKRLKEQTPSSSAALVRDVSWHPYRPEVTSVSWDGVVRQWDTTDTGTVCSDGICPSTNI